jgi:E3 ubiquitin-protein ligase synoviolin
MGGQKHVDVLRRSDYWCAHTPVPSGCYLTSIEDFLKLSTYLGFFAVIVTFYGVPLNVVRDVYVTARSFITRLRDLMRYRTATRNMDERYPNATQEEMSAMSDHICIICREEMVLPDPVTRDQANPPGTTAPARDGPNMTPKKLPCGHIFHFHCLRSWLERQQSCPTWSVSLVTLFVSRVDALA